MTMDAVEHADCTPLCVRTVAFPVAAVFSVGLSPRANCRLWSFTLRVAGGTGRSGAGQPYGRRITEHCRTLTVAPITEKNQ